jgi:hypothetical protein
MKRGTLTVIIIAAAIGVGLGVAFALDVSMQNNQLEQTLTEPAEGRNIVVTIEEKLGISEEQSP